MLKMFRFENSYSYKDSVTFDMSVDMVDDEGEIVPKHTELSEVIRYPGGRQGILPVAAIYGGNASGKTKLIKSLHDMSKDVLGDSFASATALSQDSPIEQMVSNCQFSFSDRIKDEMTYFICVILNNATYDKGGEICKGAEYQLEYTIGKKGVLKEKLQMRGLDLNSSVELLYSRDGLEVTGGIDKTINEYLSLIAAREERRLWFSQIAPSQRDGLRDLYEWFRYVRDGLTLNESEQQGEKFKDIAKRIAKNNERVFKGKLLSFLRGLDKSIVDIMGLPGGLQREDYRLWVFHKRTSGNLGSAHLIEDESAGTRKLIEQFPLINRSLEEGMPFICDELDRMLHPVAFQRLVDLFNSPKTNKYNAQLIFTAHDTIVLDSDRLRRDEVHIINKDEYSVSSIHRLSDEDMKVEQYPNMEREFRAGYYGSFPDAFLKEYETAGGHGGEK